MQVISCFEGLFKRNTAMQLKFDFDERFENYSFLERESNRINASPWTAPYICMRLCSQVINKVNQTHYILKCCDDNTCRPVILGITRENSWTVIVHSFCLQCKAMCNLFSCLLILITLKAQLFWRHINCESRGLSLQKGAFPFCNRRTASLLSVWNVTDSHL